MRLRSVLRTVGGWVRVPREIQFVRLVWCAWILYAERIVFARSAGACRVRTRDTPFHVLIITDPQVIGTGTYPATNWLGVHVLRFFSDQYIRKVWGALHHTALGSWVWRAPRADLVVLLGDVSDRGRWYTEKDAYVVGLTQVDGTAVAMAAAVSGAGGRAVGTRTVYATYDSAPTGVGRPWQP